MTPGQGRDEHFEPRQSPEEPFDAFGVHWTLWRSEGAQRWLSGDRRLGVAQEGRTFRARVDDELLTTATGQPRRFLSRTSAMQAAVDATKQEPDQ
jgi:hypothetical protein